MQTAYKFLFFKLSYEFSTPEYLKKQTTPAVRNPASRAISTAWKAPVGNDGDDASMFDIH